MKEIELDHVELMNQDDLPKGFQYPIELRKIMQLGLVNLGVWIMMDKDLAKVGIIETLFHLRRGLMVTILLVMRLEVNVFTIFKTMSVLELRKLRYFPIHGSGYVRQSTI